MKIVFHAGNAANFCAGFEEILRNPHEILMLPDQIETPADRAAFGVVEAMVTR